MAILIYVELQLLNLLYIFITIRNIISQLLVRVQMEKLGRVKKIFDSNKGGTPVEFEVNIGVTRERV